MGTLPDPTGCESPSPSPGRKGSLVADEVGGDRAELWAAVGAFPKALLSARLAVSVLALGDVGWVPVAALRLLCLDSTAVNRGAERIVGVGAGAAACCHWCTEFADASRLPTVARTGTSLLPLGGRDDHIIPVCLVGRSRRRGEESVMVWVSAGWGSGRRRRRRKEPRDERHVAAMAEPRSH